MLAYVYLGIAIVAEVLGTIAMKYSAGFTKGVPTVLTIILYGIGFITLTVALKSLPLSNVYAICAGLGTALIAICGVIFFNETMPLQKVVATGLIVVGVVILNIQSGSNQKDLKQMTEIAEKEALVNERQHASLAPASLANGAVLLNKVSNNYEEVRSNIN